MRVENGRQKFEVSIKNNVYRVNFSTAHYHGTARELEFTKHAGGALFA
jgi:hypothetical protein